MKQNKKIGILSLGCPRNLVDSENILGRLNLKGYSIGDIEGADIAIINTCGFIEDAKKESIDAILELVDLKKRGKLKKVIVYGCLAERYKYELQKALPEVDAFIGRVSLEGSKRRFGLTPAHYAYLKICESCINNCSYCVIPKIKQKFASIDIDSVLRKVKALDKEKISELNIIGQDITGYGLDLYGKPQLSKLIARITRAVRNIGWIRLIYLYPKRINEDLLDLINDQPKICKYIDLPIQHINDRILKLMNRHTTKKDILTLIGRIRKKIPGVAIRTSVIVGFPSETEKEFQELLGFIQEARFERLGAFIYSREEDTQAFDLPKQVPLKIKQERFNSIMSEQQEVSRDINAGLLGNDIDVLIEEKDASVYLGRSQHDAPEVDGLVYVKSKRALRLGDFVKVKITDTLEYDLVGEEI